MVGNQLRSQLPPRRAVTALACRTSSPVALLLVALSASLATPAATVYLLSRERTEAAGADPKGHFFLGAFTVWIFAGTRTGR